MGGILSGNSRSTLGRYLDDRGIKQSWLAGKTQIDAADISRIARGGMYPGSTRAHAIARALETSCSELGWPEYDHEVVA